MPPPPPTSTPPRFFCPTLGAASLSESPVATELLCTLDHDETRHARKVLRLSEGDRVELFDGHGRLADAQLSAFEKSRDGFMAVCRVREVRSAAEARPRITVASAVPKGPRAEAMVNQLGQLGADVFVPVRCGRSAVEPGGGKIERYEKAALASAKQSGRPWLMRVEPMADLADVLRGSGAAAGVKLLLDPRGETMAGLATQLESAEKVVVLIGPEGGWTDTELAAADAAGFLRWCINDNVLRIEAAATAAVSVLRYLAAGPRSG